ncbi:MAG: hypothetical protein R3F51_14265 [Cyanobacteriota/Melainabacteria group bacterium]
MSNYSNAYSDANRAIEINPKETIAWLVKGNAEFELGKVNESIASLTRGIELNQERKLHFTTRLEALHMPSWVIEKTLREI